MISCAPPNPSAPEGGAPIDLLFTDVVMPEMMGDELARRARQQRPELKVLFTSGYTPDDIATAERLAVEGALLHKPFGIELLATAVRKALDS